MIYKSEAVNIGELPYAKLREMSAHFRKRVDEMAEVAINEKFDRTIGRNEETKKRYEAMEKAIEDRYKPKQTRTFRR